MRRLTFFPLIVGASLASGAPSSALVLQPAEKTCNLLASEDLRRTGLEAFRGGRYSAAATAFRESIDACPSQHAVLLDLSRTDARLRDFPVAIRDARLFLELEPASIEGRLMLANAYFVGQRLPDALREAELVLKEDPAQATALKLKGNVEYLSGRRDQAMSTFVTLLDRHPEDEDGPYMLGRIYFEEGHIDQATGQFLRALKINPKHYKAYDNLGLCYQATGNTQLAKRYFLTAIKLVDTDHPDYEWPYANLARLLLDEGDAAQAFGLASRAAQRNPYSARNFYVGGDALAKLGKNELSANWLERAISLDPKYQEALYLLARVYSQLGREDKARAIREKLGTLKATQSGQQNQGAIRAPAVGGVGQRDQQRKSLVRWVRVA